MEWYEAEVRQLEETLKNDVPERPVVFYGSSSIRLWSTLREDMQIPEAINAGFGGSTLEACVHFFERVVPPLGPCSLVVYAGDNDLGDGRTSAQVCKSFQELIRKVESLPCAIPFGFISIKPSPARFNIIGKIQKANDLVRQAVETVQSAYYIDVFPAMLDATGKPRAGLFQEDGLHLNRKGYEVWTEVLNQYRNRMLIPNCRHVDEGDVS